MLAAGSAPACGADDARALAAGCRSCHQGDTIIPSLDDQTRKRDPISHSQLSVDAFRVVPGGMATDPKPRRDLLVLRA